MTESQVSMAPAGTACSRCGNTLRAVYPASLCYSCIRQGVLDAHQAGVVEMNRILDGITERMESRDTPGLPGRKRLRFEHISYHSDFMGMWHVVYRWGDGEGMHYTLTERKAESLSRFVNRLLHRGIGTMTPTNRGWVYKGPVYGYLSRWL